MPCLGSASDLNDDAFDEDTLLPKGGLLTQDSVTLDDGCKVRFFGCSLTDATIDVNESIPKGEEGAAPLDDELCPGSLFKYKGANNGGGTGNNGA